MPSLVLRRAIILALAPVSIITTAYAQTTTYPQATTPADVLDLDVITVTRTPTKTSNLTAQTTVIDSIALERHKGQNALEVIKSQPGFSSYTNGGSDKASNFYMRGFDSGSVLVLIDGIRYGSLTTGQPALGALSTNEIDRIEILYGASGSSVYGANAMGGVIQIFTKKGTADGLGASVTIGTGSHNKLTYGATLGYANENTKLNLSANHAETDGINAIAKPYVASQRDDDGFDRDSFSASLSQKINQVELGASLLASKGIVEYDDTWSPSSSMIYDKQKHGAASAYMNYNYGAGSQVRLQYGQSIDKSSNFKDIKHTGTYNSKQKQTSLSLVHALPVGKVLAGVEHVQQNVDSSVAYEKTKRHNTGYYLGYQAHYDKADTQAFVRYDDNSWYDQNTTYNIGLGYRITPSVRIGANHATGFKVPTFNQLYWPKSGNPNLRPETSKNTEAFIELMGDHHKTRITGYHSDVADLIDGWPAKNINKAEVQGITLTTDWVLNNGYTAGLSFDYQESNDVTPSSSNKKTKSNLPFRPEHKGTAYLGYVGDSYNLRFEYQRIGSYYAAANHSGKINGYGLLNLSGTYELNPHVSVTHRLNNILNKKYITNESWGTRYNEDGINFYTAITLKY